MCQPSLCVAELAPSCPSLSPPVPTQSEVQWPGRNRGTEVKRQGLVLGQGRKWKDLEE